MNSRIYWKIALVVFLTLWAFFEIYPPTNRDLITVFEERASGKDANFEQIVKKARELQEKAPKRGFANLFEAVGTNSIKSYFPDIKLPAEGDPNRVILQKLQRDSAGQIHLGIDLQGGTYFVMGMDEEHHQEALAAIKSDIASATNDTQRAQFESELKHAEDRQRLISQAVEVLRKRVDKLGVAEPIIQPLGEDSIVVQLPGLTEQDRQEAISVLEKAAFLEFRMVHENSQSLLSQGIIPPGYEMLKQERKDRNGQLVTTRAIVKKRPEHGLTGNYVKNSFVSRDPMTTRPIINLNFNSEGAKLFGQVTKENVNHQMAIVLDGVLYSAPNINEPITGGQCVISGDFELKEAFELASVLENPLETPLKIKEERTVDPSLGADSIRSSTIAVGVGLASVVIFVLVYYLRAGLVANVALVLNIIFLVGVLCQIDATLTLPGIAGILLTVGMAIDANVLIFERIREELEAGKSVKGALQAGYGKAFGTILDANVTTLIASVILIFMGTGPVKGFGVTLTIGLVVSMFTALFVTRLIFDIMIDKGMLKTFPMLQFKFLHNTKFDFLAFAKPAFIISWTLVIVGMGYGIYRGGNAVGVDFKGGDSVTYTFGQKLDEDAIRAAIAEMPNTGEPQVSYSKSMADAGHEILQVLTVYGSGQTVAKGLAEKFPDTNLKMIGVDRVGPTIGTQILQSALIAVLLSIFGILVYVAFRYEFSFAIGAIVATVHDIFMTLGWFFLAKGELSAPMVAAVLTIIGFSINDTIVIFDRIREDLRQGRKGTFKDIINVAINQTLSRTLITSGTTLLAAGSLWLFGGGVIHDFAFTFVVGIITGTYSSIYIAATVVLWWHKGHKPKAAPQVFSEEPIRVTGA